ncbi:MAG: hypothetical protein A6F70_00570 [Cycloclasticus sp. symbiont of Bathymodiolus heckerae]|nr:MAG: hypothetical protein A6F70_00570 [Cycloclasticus sp. symbiont of Bathymodiolus heckerae]
MTHPRFKTLLFFIAFYGLILGIYSPGISGPFVFDDITNITTNTALRVTDLNFINLTTAALSGEAGPLKRPVAMISFAFNYYFAEGYSAPHFKITNILIQCLNATLVFILSLQLYKTTAVKTGSSTNLKHATAFAFIISLLWAVHPINLTSVLYVVQRMTLLSTLFSLGSIILYLSARNRWVNHSFSWRVAGLFFTGIISLLFALFSKENAVLIPFIILLIELVFYTHEKPWPFIKKLSKKQRLAGIIAIISISTVALFWAIDYAAGGFNSRTFTMLERVLTESRVVCLYIAMIFIPRINSFGLFHDDIILSTSLLSPWTTITSIIFILGLLITAFHYRKKNPLFALGIGWFFIGHLLESTFFPLEIAHEHRNHLPSIGLIIAAISCIPIQKFNYTKNIILIILVSLILASITWIRSNQWSNRYDQAFYETLHHPLSAAAQTTFSSAAGSAGKYNEALMAIKKASQIDPKEIALPIYYQHTLSILKLPITKETQDETLLRIKLNKITATTKLALSEIANCLHKEICEPLRENYIGWINAVILKQPNIAYYYLFKGKAESSLGNNLKALNAFQLALSKDPEYIQPLYEIINILLKNGQILNALTMIEQFKKKNHGIQYPQLIKLENDIKQQPRE